MALLFDRWRNIEYLFEFFTKNRDDLQSFFRVDTIGQAVRDTLDDADALEALVLEFPFTEQLDEVFKPLGIEDEYAVTLNREKERKRETGIVGVTQVGLEYMQLDLKKASML